VRRADSGGQLWCLLLRVLAVLERLAAHAAGDRASRKRPLAHPEPARLLAAALVDGRAALGGLVRIVGWRRDLDVLRAAVVVRVDDPDHATVQGERLSSAASSAP
jgi:hypothetical protein